MDRDTVAPGMPRVIVLTSLNGHRMALNSDLIKLVEDSPDTVITLLGGEKLLVRESTEEVIARVVRFRQDILAGVSWASSGSLPAPAWQHNHNRAEEAHG